MSAAASHPDTVLFWWVTSIIQDQLTMGRLLPVTPSPNNPKGLVPQSPQALPGDQQCLYPAVYFPVTYGDLSLFAQTRGDEAGIENIRQRGALVVRARIDAVNYHLNWNQTDKQRIRALRKFPGVVVLTEIQATTGIGAHTVATSPLFSDEPDTKFRKPLRSKRHTKAPVHATLMQVIRREDTRRRNKGKLVEHPENAVDAPHDKRTTSYIHRPIPLPIKDIPEGQRLSDVFSEQDIREAYDIAADDAELDMPPGMKPLPPVDDNYNKPMCCQS